MARSHLVVGGNRGIGLALVQELVSRYPEDIVYATLRDPKNSFDLDGLSASYSGRVRTLQLEMLDEAQVESVAKNLAFKIKSLDSVIINGATIAGQGPLVSLTPQDLLTNLRVNVVGPHTIIRHFSPLLLASSAERRSLILISSIGGSITNAKAVGDRLKGSTGLDHVPLSGYVTSKSALNMLGRQWADVLEPKGVEVLAIHPGGVDTRMTKGMQGTISTAESAKGCVDAWEKADITKSGDAIFSYDGTTIPW